MHPNALASRDAILAAALDPQSLAPGAASTGYVKAADYGALQAIVQAGALGAAATVDAKLEQATSAAGAGKKDVAGKAITQLTKAGGDDSQQAIINLRPDELDVAGGFTYVRLTVTVGAAASDVAGLILGSWPRYNPDAAATVAEVIA